MLYPVGISLLLNCCFVCIEGYSSGIYEALSIWQPLYNLLYSARFFFKVVNGLFFLFEYYLQSETQTSRKILKLKSQFSSEWQ